MTYRVLLQRKAEKFLARVPKRDYIKLRAHLDQLSKNPHPPGSIKLEGSENIYRLRYGNYRILYTVENDQLIIYIIEIAHRKDVYRK